MQICLQIWMLNSLIAVIKRLRYAFSNDTIKKELVKMFSEYRKCNNSEYFYVSFYILGF